MRRGRGRRPPNAKDAAAELARAERRARAFALRTECCSFPEIGRRLGISHTQAENDVKRAIAEHGEQTKVEQRALANGALEAVLEGHVSSARKGDHKSAHVVVSAVATHSRINGYEAPAEVAVSGMGLLAIHVTAREAQAFDAVEEATGVPELNGARH
jgi:hypothetical protein